MRLESNNLCMRLVWTWQEVQCPYLLWLCMILCCSASRKPLSVQEDLLPHWCGTGCRQNSRWCQRYEDRPHVYQWTQNLWAQRYALTALVGHLMIFDLELPLIFGRDWSIVHTETATCACGACAEWRRAGAWDSQWDCAHTFSCWAGCSLWYCAAGDGGLLLPLQFPDPPESRFWAVDLSLQYDHVRISTLAKHLVDSIMNELPQVIRNGDPEQSYPGNHA